MDINNDLIFQLAKAKKDMCLKTYLNKKTKSLYLVQTIVVCSETLELRVIYRNQEGFEWDRPLNLFLQKFELFKGGN